MKKPPRAHILVGLGYGDEGKGTMTDYLCRSQDFDLVVRYNGGSQAGHNVVTDDGRHHCFQQIGSGTFAGAATLLSKFMMVDPFALAFEASALWDRLGSHPLEKHYIDARCPIITPFHIAANRVREWGRGGKRHGSCGKGIGELGNDLLCHPTEVIRASQMVKVDLTTKLLTIIQNRLKSAMPTVDLPPDLRQEGEMLMNADKPRAVAESMAELTRDYFKVIDEKLVWKMIKHSRVLFEGAQGMALDEDIGFHPHTTWSNITPVNALAMLKEASFRGDFECTGITRSYTTRHGRGPHMTERPDLRNFSPNEHNRNEAWQEDFRVGLLDGPLLAYTALHVHSVIPMSGIALTHMDLGCPGLCESYVYPGDGVVDHIPIQTGQSLANRERMTNLLKSCTPGTVKPIPCDVALIAVVQGLTRANVSYVSYGPTAKMKRTTPHGQAVSVSA